jgi:cell wall-associated NlpC family hydrolase
MPSPRTVLAGAVGLTAVAAVSACGLGAFRPARPAPAPAAAVPGATSRPPRHVGTPAAAVPTQATISRAQVLARARTWHPHTAQRVPYSQLRTRGGYRTDCSGYASMALALDGPGPITTGLAGSAYSTPISMSELQPGDLVIDPTGTSDSRHVVIFVKWADSRHTAYDEYEQRGGYGTDYRTRTYGLAAGSQYHAYRPKKIR